MDHPGRTTSMQVVPTELPDVRVIQPRIFTDDRGFFLETYNEARYLAAGIDARFVQDNHSRSAHAVLRGLHYQVEHPQAKLVGVLSGRIFDVAVDVRPGSHHFGRWVGVVLDAISKHQLFIPEGFAHGFCVLSEAADVCYKCSGVYRPDDEAGIIYNDRELEIPWPVDRPILSAKDRAHPPLRHARRPAT